MVTLSLLTALAITSLPDYDVVVYGSTPAGIAAATAAGHLGMKVALFEPLKVNQICEHRLEEGLAM